MLTAWLAGVLPLIGCVAGTLFTQVSLGHVELAKYSGSGTGGSGADSQTIPQPAAPTALVSGHNVTVSWPTTTMSGGTPVPGYAVQRYTAAGVAGDHARGLHWHAHLDVVRRVGSTERTVALLSARNRQQLDGRRERPERDRHGWHADAGLHLTDHQFTSGRAHGHDLELRRR